MVINIIKQLIAAIDIKVKEQLTAILKNNNFQALNATWSGVYYLINIAHHNSVKIKILDLKWEEIIAYTNNISGNLDTPLAHKILDEFELPGNSPLSLVVGNYTLDIADRTTVITLNYLADICSTIFAPFISTITPEIFDIDNFSQLAKIDIDVSNNKKFQHFLSFSESKSSSFVGLVIPKVFLPSLVNYKQKTYCPILGTAITNYNNILGNGAFAYAAVAINSFIQTGWFLDTIGMPTNNGSSTHNEGFGQVPSLTASTFFDKSYNIPFGFFKYITEFYISEKKEKELSNIGFIPLCHIKNRDIAVFYSNNSVKNLNIEKTPHHSISETSNVLYTLQYILCACRFAHYIKIISRQKLGLYTNISEFETYLNNWLLQYISSDIATSIELKHKYPLLAAKVEITQDKFLKDSFNCIIYLQPHLISMQASAEIILNTKLLMSII